MVAEFEGQITKCRREGKDIKISCVLKSGNTYEAEIIFKTIDFENPQLNEKYFRTGKFNFNHLIFFNNFFYLPLPSQLMKQLPLSFFERDSVKVAQELLGKVIQVGKLKARIVETEAYGRDPASHAFKRTERSSLMFDTFGHAYIYFIYGMYWCLNFTTNPKGEAGAVLIRALEPLTGIKEMQKRRKTNKIENLCSGPGKLCSALGIDKQFNGLRLGKEIRVYDNGFKLERIGRSPRIGIKDAKELEWRFFIKGSRFVSKIKN